MNIWIVQDEPGVNMRAKLKIEGTIEPWWWNVDRYIKDLTDPHIEIGDKVLIWQPNLDYNNPAGIYAVGEVVKPPYYSIDAKKNYRIKFKVLKVLEKPISRGLIMEDPLLREMQIIKMAGGHIVFRVNSKEWDELQRLCKDLVD